LLPLLRLPAWAVALLLSVLLEATFAWLLALGRVGDGVVVAFPLGSPVSPLLASLQNLLRRQGGNEAVTAVAGKVLTARFWKCLLGGERVFRLKKLHQRPLHLPIPQALRDVNVLFGKRINPV
jgi:hypothetical protein